MTFRSFGGSGGSVTFAAPSGDIAIDNPTQQGTSPDATRADHVHAFPKAAAGTGATTSTPGDTEQDGTATTAAASDHVHGREGWGTSGEIGTGMIGTSAGAGTSGAVADAGHTHAASSFGDSAQIGTGAIGTTAAAGTSGAVADAGHTHTASDWGAAVDIAELAAAASAGATGAVADAGHVHPWTGLVPADLITAIGELFVGAGNAAVEKLDPGTAGYVLTSAGPGALPTWSAIPAESPSTVIFVDQAAVAQSLPNSTEAQLTGTSGATPSSPVRVHNISSSKGYAVAITGQNSGVSYTSSSVPALPTATSSSATWQYPLDLVVTEPLNVEVSQPMEIVYTPGLATAIT